MNRRTLLSILFTFVPVGLIFVWTVGLHRVEDWSFHFSEMPSADDELRQWLTDQPNVEGAEAWRDGDALCLRYRVRFWRRGLNRRDFISPLERCGYKGFSKSTMREHVGWGW
jgi:hypothetical protein